MLVCRSVSNILQSSDLRQRHCSGKGLGVPPSYTLRYRSLLTTEPHSTDVAIEGAGPLVSKIDGNGWLWWSRFEHLGLAAGRPHLVEPLFVRRFRIEGVHLQDSPFWSLHPYACDDVIIRGLHITADPVRGHNTDGVDPVSNYGAAPAAFPSLLSPTAPCTDCASLMYCVYSAGFLFECVG